MSFIPGLRIITLSRCVACSTRQQKKCASFPSVEEGRSFLPARKKVLYMSCMEQRCVAAEQTKAENQMMRRKPKNRELSEERRFANPRHSKNVRRPKESECRSLCSVFSSAILSSCIQKKGLETKYFLDDKQDENDDWES
jgi:hypothetical protein